MWTWPVLATIVSLLFGTHNLFVKRAAGRVPDAWGALVLETAAVGVILAGLAVLALFGKAPPVPRDPGGVAQAAVAGALVGLGSVLYFAVFRLGAPLAVAVPWVLNGWVAVVAVLGVVVEGESLAWRQIGGLVAAMAAIWLLR
jgi:transporter family protein